MKSCPSPIQPTVPAVSGARTGADRRSRLRLLCGLASLAMAGACGGGGGGGAEAVDAAGAAPAPVAGTPAPSPAASPSAAPAAWGSAKSSARLFISGHSLTDDPLGDDIVLIANSMAGNTTAARYNEQILLGSPIRSRTDQAAGWAGYSRGKNRGGTSGLNVIDELRNPQTLGAGERYDTLVIAENHNLLEMLQWENTVRNLRHYHERLLAGNSNGRTYFYETWKDVFNKSDPRGWIAHERGASQAWQCIAQRVNTSLAAENRADRITPLPVGAALADLVERATQGNVAGITGANATETINRLFSDNVHLTPTGMYYAALVTYSAVYQRSPVGAAAPSGVSAAAAQSLQSQAWNYVSNFYANYRAPNLDSCRAQVAQTYCTTYWNYRGNAANAASCGVTFALAAITNPLYYLASGDSTYWFRAP